MPPKEYGRYLPDDYYMTVRRANPTSPFLSPCRSPDYAMQVAHWFAEAGSSGTSLAEIGPGYGEIVRLMGRRAPASTFWVIDKCGEFLDIALRVWTGPLDRLIIFRADVETGIPIDCQARPPRQEVNRLVAINVMQDVDLGRALQTLTRWMAPNGRIWITVLAKETMDEYYLDNPMYSPLGGLYYKPASNGSQILGYRYTPAGGVMAYERVLRFRTSAQSIDTLRRTGFRIIRKRSVAFSADEMIARWRSLGTLDSFPTKALRQLKSCGSYVDSWEFVAECAD